MSRKTEAAVVYVSMGAGNAPTKVALREDDTISDVLRRANVTLANGMVPTIGDRPVENPDTTEAKAGDLIVIAGKPGNG